VVKVRARNAAGKEGDLTFKRGGMAKVIPGPAPAEPAPPAAAPAEPPLADTVKALEGLGDNRLWRLKQSVLGGALTQQLTGEKSPISLKEPTEPQAEAVDRALRAVAAELGLGDTEDAIAEAYGLGPDRVTPDVIKRALARVAPDRPAPKPAEKAAGRPEGAPKSPAGPSESDVTAAREAVKAEVFGTPEYNRKTVEAIDKAAEANGRFFRDRAARNLGTTLGADPLLDKIREAAEKVSKQDSTMSHDRSLINRLDRIAGDPNETPARRKVATELAEWGRSSRLAEDPSAKQALRDAESDLSALKRAEEGRAGSRVNESAAVRKIEKSAAVDVLGDLSKERPGIEQDLVNADARMAGEYGRASTVAKIRAEQIKGTDQRIESTRAAMDAMRTDEGRAALQAEIQHLEWERRNLVEQEQVNRITAEQLRNELISSHERREKTRRAEFALLPSGTSGVPERIRQEWSDQEDADKVLAEINASIPPSSVPVDEIKKQARVEKRRAGITDAGMKRMPYEQRAFAREAAQGITNAIAAPTLAADRRRAIGIFEERLKDPELRPYTRQKLQKLVKSLKAGHAQYGATVPVTDADVERFREVRDFHVAAWRAASIADPGSRDEMIDEELTAGLDSNEKARVRDLNAMIGVNAARMFAEWLQNR
jgi:hypothetical protein